MIGQGAEQQFQYSVRTNSSGWIVREFASKIDGCFEESISKQHLDDETVASSKQSNILPMEACSTTLREKGWFT